MKGGSALAVIPARGGSKGVPHKNVRDLCGKPLIAYTISAALEADIFDEIVVSTDDSAIAEISRQHGAAVPFLRPADLAADSATSDAVMFHAVQYFLSYGIEFDYVCKLQPTSPLRTAKHLQESYAQFRVCDEDYMVSVCPCEHTPLWSLTLDSKGCLNRFILDKPNGVRQDLPVYYRLNGAIYWARTEEFIKTRDFFAGKFRAYMMKPEESIDIDSIHDFALAEFYLQHYNKGG